MASALDVLFGNNKGPLIGTPGINPGAPDPRVRAPEPQNPLDEFLGGQGGSLLMNLLAQQGFSKTPQSPLGALGRGLQQTREQSQQSARAGLEDELLRSRIGLNNNRRIPSGPDQPSSVREFEFFSSLGNQDDPNTISPAQARFLEVKRARPNISIPGAGVGNIVGGEFRPAVSEDTVVAGTGARAEAGARGQVEGSEAGLSTAERAVDTEFGKTFVAWTQGGSADATKGLSQLKSARQQLDNENISGPVIGNTPNAILATINPRAADAKAKIEEVVQRNLRLVLGAQFTEKEGERLISRAFDQRLPEEINAERLDRLIRQIELSIEAKQDQSLYFIENGTLKGWQGKIPTIDDFDAALDDPSGSSAGVRKRFNPATGRIEEIG